VRIKCTTRFKDKVDDLPVSFEEGDVRSVSERDGARFVGHGWAVEEGGVVTAEVTVSPSSVDLDVHNASLGSSDNLGA